MIAQKTIQEVYDVAKVEEVIQDFLPLKRAGANMKGLCPFHNEKTPSFTVSPAKNLYKCFGCGKGGTPITFVMEHENMSYPDAIRYLAKKYRIEIEETELSSEELEKRQLNDSLYIINEFAKQYFSDQLFLTDKGKSIGLSYFKKRGYREETIRKFGLGFAPDSSDGLTNFATSGGHKIEMLQNLGLTTQNRRDFFRNRVMFTIFNLSGKPIAFAGRILQKDVKAPKYINSPETEIYHKSKALYGMFQAKQEIRKLDECLLVEGYTDVITLHQGGIENVVASSGTALTADQLRLIKRFTPNLKIIYDGDPAGIKAALRGLDLALEQDLDVKIVLLPSGEDPDSYLQQVGGKGFRDFIDQHAQDFILFKMEILLEETKGDPVKKAHLVKDIVSSIARIPDHIKRSVYIQECSRLLQMEESILMAEMNKVVKNLIQQAKPGSGDQALVSNVEVILDENVPDVERPVHPGKVAIRKPTVPDEEQERDIVRILVNFGGKMYDKEHHISIAEFVLGNIDDILHLFDHMLYRQIIHETMDLFQAQGDINPQFYVNHIDKDISDLAIELLQSPHFYSQGWEDRNIYLRTQKMPDENYVRDSTDAVKKVKLRKVQRLLDQNEKRIGETSDEHQRGILIQVHMRLLTTRNELAKELNHVILR